MRTSFGFAISLAMLITLTALVDFAAAEDCFPVPEEALPLPNSKLNESIVGHRFCRLYFTPGVPEYALACSGPRSLFTSPRDIPLDRKHRGGKDKDIEEFLEYFADAFESHGLEEVPCLEEFCEGNNFEDVMKFQRPNVQPGDCPDQETEESIPMS
ncbi:MAG: hypothetical protein AAF202_01485 [Pseudomonadota bacterium]